MKFIDMMLDREISWIEGAEYVAHDKNGISFFTSPPKFDNRSGRWEHVNGYYNRVIFDNLAEDWTTAIISHKEYRIAQGEITINVDHLTHEQKSEVQSYFFSKGVFWDCTDANTAKYLGKARYTNRTGLHVHSDIMWSTITCENPTHTYEDIIAEMATSSDKSDTITSADELIAEIKKHQRGIEECHESVKSHKNSISDLTNQLQLRLAEVNLYL